jgi:ribonuclease-3
MRRSWLSFLGAFNSGASAKIKKLESVLKYRFKNKSILRSALAHKSYLRSRTAKEVFGSNERMEFLGDSVLGLVVSDFLYSRYPGKPEGELTKMKATLVNEVTLSRRAKEFGLGQYLLLSPEEETSGGRQRESILADACEAIIAAAYLDGGMKAAQKTVGRLVLEKHQEVTEDKAQHNHKGELLEYLQARGLGMPSYQVEITEGPDHNKQFTIAAICQGRKLGTGRGGSKKEAEQIAARAALRKLRTEGLAEDFIAQKTGQQS